MTTSGDKAITEADARAAATRDVNITTAPPLPIDAETANVRLGPEIDQALLTLLPLIGIWRGVGRFGNEPGEHAPQFGQQITFAHDGRAFVRYESIMWLLDADRTVTGPGDREVGWLKPTGGAGAGGFEFTVAHAQGGISSYVVTAHALTQWECVGSAGSRLYGVTPDGRLAYVDERVPDPKIAHATDAPEPVPHASAALERIAG